MRVPRRGSLTTMPRRRSSASPAETVAGLIPASAAMRLPEGRRWPASRRPAPTACSIPSTSSEALLALIGYCFRSDIDVYHNRLEDAVAEREGGAQPSSDRVRLRRRRDRGSYDRETVQEILDEGLIAHLGIVEDGQPLVIPTLHARDRDVVYLHGSSAGRTMRTMAGGAPVCLTVSLIDGLVLARAAMHHSANYRSVVLLGRARLVSDREELMHGFETVVERIVPGRWAEVRPPSEKEMKATSLLAMGIEEASAKVRTGPPLDDEEDYALPAWAGVIPLALTAGEPQADPRLPAGTRVPAHLTGYGRGGL
jgi:nitroimidazol reductase NimA-like FMN-containing flavoprotein (pyridoxamine 5'-phosphate oxidase superfamily)